jgi:hypothetical protein
MFMDDVPSKLHQLFYFISAPILYRHAPQQTEKSGTEFKNLKCSKQTLHSGSTGCHNYYLKYYFFALYVSSYLKVVFEPQWEKFVHGEIGQFFLVL